MCHYCQATAELPGACPACGKKLLLFGLGIQRIESELARKFPQAAVARMDSDTMTSPRQFREVFDGFAAGRIDILLGTQMVAKGLDFPRVTLVGVVSADTALAIPDFRAAERTFQLVVQVAGRAGRAERGGEVVVQTWHPSDPAIRFALQHDYAGFAAGELPLRKSAGVPPFVRLVRFVVRHHSVDRAESGIRALAEDVRGLFAGERDVKLVGPMRAGVFKIRRQFRFQLNCYCPRAGFVQGRLVEQMPKLAGRIGAEVVVDADPVNLL
jgi:primosomal protein N' (replication factor Y)